VCLCVDLCVGGCKAAYRQQGLPLSLSLSLICWYYIWRLQ
jgi:hypothetical protein